MVKVRGPSFHNICLERLTHPQLNIMVEIEREEQLPFIDILVTRKCTNKFQFDVFRNDIHTNRYIPYNSHRCRQHG